MSERARSPAADFICMAAITNPWPARACRLQSSTENGELRTRLTGDDGALVQRGTPWHGTGLQSASGYHRRCSAVQRAAWFSGRACALLAILARLRKGASMPAYGWGGDVGLERWLFDEPYAFDFFQAVHLLELWSKAARSPRPERMTEAVRFRASFDLSFPPSAIRKLRPGTAGAPAEMTVAFSSLGGIDGPLPTSFTEEILRRLSEHDSAAAAFLDIFHHRLISLLYRVRKRRAPALAATVPEHTAAARYLFSLIGLGLESLAGRCRSPPGCFAMPDSWPRDRDRQPAWPCFSRTTSKCRSGSNSSSASGSRCQADQVTNIGQAGQNHALGRTATLGSRVWIQDAGVRLHIGPLDAACLREFSSGRRRPPHARGAGSHLRGCRSDGPHPVDPAAGSRSTHPSRRLARRLDLVASHDRRHGARRSGPAPSVCQRSAARLERAS